MDLQSYLRAVRRSWWLIVLACVVGAGLGGAAAALATPQYRSSVVFFVSTPTDRTGTAFQADQFAQRRVNSYVGLLTSDELAQRVVAASGTDESVAAVRSAISASADLNTVLLTASVTTSSPERSVLYARTISEQLGGLVDNLDNKGATAVPNVVLNVISGPTGASDQVSPNIKLYLALGLALGFVVGIGLAVLRELRLDRTVRSQDTLRAVVAAPVLGAVPWDKATADSPVAVGVHAGSKRAEAFRQVRTALRFLDAANPVRVVAVTSAVADEGRTTTALNLALAFATGGARTLFVEADLRRPRAAAYLGLPATVGLSDVLVGEVELADVVHEWGDARLSVLVSGPVPPNPSELLGTPAMASLLATARERYDAVVVDTPPVLPVTDAAVVSVQVDGVVVVVRHGGTTRAQVASTGRVLRGVEARVLGAVLTAVPQRDMGAYDEYQTYVERTGPGGDHRQG